MKHLMWGIAALALVACGGSGDNTSPLANGPLKLGIVSGQNQVVTAGSSQLGAPVVGKLVRQPNGTVAFIQAGASRALDLIVPRAFAQGTVVTGSPVPNAVVCAVSTDTVHALTPFTPCTNTDANGQATFYFTPGKAAGVAKAEIRGSLNNQPAVFDTASATVTADTATAGMVARYASIGVSGYAVDPAHPSTTYAVLARHANASLDLSTAIDSVVDKYHNRIPTFTVGWTAVQLSSETLTMTSDGQVSGYPPAVPTSLATSVPAHTGTQVTGLQPGYVVLATYVDGVFQGTMMLAVLP